MTCDAQHPRIEFDAETCPLCEMREKLAIACETAKWFKATLDAVIERHLVYLRSMQNGPADIDQPRDDAKMPATVPVKVPTRLDP